MSAKRHPHEFSLLYWHFGPYGRQDVHVHSCHAGNWLPDRRDDDPCDRVLIGEGRSCDGRPESHHRETLHA